MAPSTLLCALIMLVGSADAMRVLVTGAGGRTGKLVFEQLSANTATTPVRQTTTLITLQWLRVDIWLPTLRQHLCSKEIFPQRKFSDNFQDLCIVMYLTSSAVGFLMLARRSPTPPCARRPMHYL